ncbi:hypothetical protein B566_EDAN002081 [Ephemera danica]|nr:hypothetical protein B566_EDAN002081 [Ephemera danica]
MDEHPVLREMQRLGCGNYAQVDLAFQTYIVLSERNLLYDVRHQYCAELDAVLLTARKKRDAETEVYVPVAASSEITPAWLRDLPQAVGQQRVTLALVDAGTVILYELQPGMHLTSRTRHRKPPDPVFLLADEIRQHVVAVTLNYNSHKEN